MDKKYELTEESIEHFCDSYYRIRAIRDFDDVRKGDLGGFIGSEKNLSHEGNCWVYNNARVFDNGLVCDNGKIYDSSIVSGYGKVCGNACVYGNSKIFGKGKVCGNAEIYHKSIIYGNGVVRGNGKVYGKGLVAGNAIVAYTGIVLGNAVIKGNAVVKSKKDYIVFKNNWSSGRYFTWTKSNNMWTVGCFYGTGEELIKKAYEDSEESGKNYESYVRFVEENFL